MNSVPHAGKDMLSLFGKPQTYAKKGTTMNNIYETLCTITGALSAQFPACIRTDILGTSHIGREIPILQLGDGYGHRLLYIGGITGNPLSAALLLRFARDYAEAAVGSGKNNGSGRVAGIDISYLLHTRTITVVPLLNPDGAVLRLHGDDPQNPLLDRLRACRAPYTDADPEHPFSDLVTNGRGVDLRCNCDADFDECIRTSHGIGVAGFPGMHPESEPECAAVCRYLRAQPTTDLTLLFDDEDSGGMIGRITYADSGTSCGGDRRTAGIASILARDTDGGSCITGVSAAPGSFARWYRTLHAGPMLTYSYPGFREEARALLTPDGTQEEIAETLLYTAAGFDAPIPSQTPGNTLYAAEFAILYAKIRRALFHGTVL